ncbi:hypothetical protein ABZT04_43365 [Streptomyces sp. NPDC005492]|uniref:hypothetical protein n=1 Tax=Streptomyces sp. NPDC005492 TaxID=3156883 RepID=UPI0033A9D309
MTMGSVRQVARFDPARVMAVGYAVSAVRLGGLLLADADTGVGTLSAVSVVLGAAIGPAQLAGVAALSVWRSGLAAASISAGRRVGTALGVAVLGLIVATCSGTRMGAEHFSDGFVRGLHASGVVTASATLASAVLLAVHARAARSEVPRRPRQSWKSGGWPLAWIVQPGEEVFRARRPRAGVV